jgi:predicted DNA-binding transcriptional regulator AlpA
VVFDEVEETSETRGVESVSTPAGKCTEIPQYPLKKSDEIAYNLTVAQKQENSGSIPRIQQMASNSQGGTVAESPFVGVKELKQVLMVKRDETIKAMIEKGQLPQPKRLGAKTLWPRHELAAALGIEL